MEFRLDLLLWFTATSAHEFIAVNDHANSAYRYVGNFLTLNLELLVNPRRACAARVTVVGLCVCPSVCLSTTILAPQATRRLMSDTNSFSATRACKNNVAILLKRLRSRDMANMHNQH